MFLLKKSCSPHKSCPDLRGDNRNPACRQAGIPIILLSRLMNFFFVLMKRNKNHDKSKKHCSAQNNIISHYSSLFKIVAKIKNTTQSIKPNNILLKFIPVASINWPKITMAKTRFPALYRALPNSFFWFFVNLINKILSEAKMFVKPRNKIYRVKMGSGEM